MRAGADRQIVGPEGQTGNIRHRVGTPNCRGRERLAGPILPILESGMSGFGLGSEGGPRRIFQQEGDTVKA